MSDEKKKESLTLLIDPDVLVKIHKYNNYNWNEIVERYLKEITDQLDKQEEKENSSNEEFENPQEIIKKVLESPKVTHAVYGCFPEYDNQGLGHRFQIVEGKETRKSFEQMFSMEITLINGKEKEFIAKSVLLNTNKGVLFVLDFPDRRGDSRMGSHTIYFLLIPHKEKELVQAIRDRHDLLYLIFKNKFPNYDRSPSEGIIIEDYDEHLEFDDVKKIFKMKF